MRIVKIGFFVALILLVVVPLVLWNQLAAEFNVTNNSSLASFKVSKLLGNVFLWRIGYLDKVEVVNITYVDELQDVYRLHNDDQPVMSLGGTSSDKTINLIYQYSPEKFPSLQEVPNWFDIDLLAGICIFIEGQDLRPDGCYTKASNYLKWAKQYRLDRIVKIPKGLFSYLHSIIVQSALAQTCVGIIPCGTPVQNYVCRLPNGSTINWPCSTSGAACGPQSTGTCQPAGQGCQIEGGQTNNCGNLTSQEVCSTAGVNRCSPVGCNPSAEIFCSWVPPYNPPPYVPPPITPPSPPPPNPTQWFGCINNACSSSTWSSQGACQAAGATNCQTGSCPVCQTAGCRWSGCYNTEACAWQAFDSQAECEASGAYDCNDRCECPDGCRPRMNGNKFFYFFEDANTNGNWDWPTVTERRIVSGSGCVNGACESGNTYTINAQQALGIAPSSLQFDVAGGLSNYLHGVGNNEQCNGGPESSCFNNRDGPQQCANQQGSACGLGFCGGDRNLKEGQIYMKRGESGWYDATLRIPIDWQLSPGTIDRWWNSNSYSNFQSVGDGTITFRFHINSHHLVHQVCSGVDGIGLMRNYRKSCSISARGSSGAVSNNGVITISNTETLTITGGAYSTAPYAEPSRLVVYKEAPGNPQSTVQITPLIPNTVYQNSPNIPQHFYLFNTGLQVPNYNFESGSTVGWMGVGVDNFVVTANTAYSGTRSLVARPILGSPDIYVASDFINTGIAVANQTYTLQFAMRSHANNVTVNNIGLQSMQAGVYTYRSIGAINLTPQWQFFERSVTFPAGLSDTQIRAVFRTPSVGWAEQVYIDSVKILRSNTGYDCSTGYGSNCTGHAQMSNLAPGTYKFWCDLPTASGPHPQTCSGNPTCTVNGGTQSCTWPSCSPNDTVTVNVTCATACGNGCPTTDLGAPTTTITAPAAGNNTIAAQGNTLNIAWSSTPVGLAENYDIRIFNRAALPSPNQNNLSNNLACGNNVLCFNNRVGTSYAYNPNASSYTGAVSAATGNAIGDQITIAVRGRNTTCGDETGPWVWQNVDLRGNIPTQVRVISVGEACIPTSGTLANFSGNQTYTATSTRYPNQSQISSSNQHILSNLRYLGSNWPERYSLRLGLNNPDPNNTYICASCSTGSNTSNCAPANGDAKTAPDANTAYFYLLNYNLSNSAWFQWVNGVAFGHNTYSSRIPNVCNSNCTARMSIALSQPELGRAGIPLGGNSISHGPNSGTGYSERPLNTGRYAQNLAFNRVTVKDYHYYLSLINFEAFGSYGGNPETVATVSHFTNFLNNSNWQDLNEGEEEEGKTIRAIYREGDLTINASSTEGRWNIPSGDKYLIFVNGNLTLRGAPDTRAITVESGGFLAFIVSGDITFENSVGYTVSETTRPETFRSLDQTNVEGIFNATGNLIIASDGSDTTIDRKFLGAGSFIGWEGIELQRSFDNSDVGRALHNNSPTELFFYRPEFLLDTPRVLRETGLLWQQVN